MPEDRYKFTKVVKDEKTNVRKYSSTLPPTIEKQETDIYIRSKQGDRLDILAQEYYQDQTLWWIIAQANQLGKGTLIIDPGLQIRIPMNPDDVIKSLKDQNEAR